MRETTIGVIMGDTRSLTIAQMSFGRAFPFFMDWSSASCVICYSIFRYIIGY